MNKKWLVFILVISLLFGCSPNNPAPVNAGGTPTENAIQLLEQAATETARPPRPTVIVSPTLSDAEIAAARTASASRPLDLLTIVFPDGSEVAFTAADLRTLPESTVVLKDQQQATGTPILSILDKAGWSRYEVNTIAIQGSGLIKLSKAQLDGNFLLSVGNTNIRFISPLVPKADWPTEVRIIALY